MSDEEGVGGMSSPGPPEEEPQSKERDEGEEPQLEAVRRELEGRRNLLLPQLQRLNESCRVHSTRLKARCEKIARALGRLEELEGKISGMAGDELSEARKTLEQAQLCYNGVVSDPADARRDWLWMCGVPALWALVFGVLLFYGWATSCRPGWMSHFTGPVEEEQAKRAAAAFCTVLYCVCAGGLGGAAAALKDFSYFRGKRVLDPAWKHSYAWRPVLGVIMGVVAWALLRGGVLLVSPPAPPGAEGGAVAPALPVSNAVYFCVAFLAGFAVEQMVRKLYDIAETVFAVTDRTRRGG